MNTQEVSAEDRATYTSETDRRLELHFAIPQTDMALLMTDLPLNKHKRHESILEILDSAGEITISDIVNGFEVSGMTARRDLEELAIAGLLRRNRGGAVKRLGRSFEPPYRTRASANHDAKQQIAKRAAELILPGDAIGIDVGSTTLALASAIDTPNITVVTASLRVATRLAERFTLEEDLRVITLGGVLRGEELSVIGGMIDHVLSSLRLDRCFIGLGGLTADDGGTEFNLEDANVKMRMIEHSSETIVLVDSSKLGHVAFVQVAQPQAIDLVITDASAPPDQVDQLRDAGIQVEIADDA